MGTDLSLCGSRKSSLVLGLDRSDELDESQLSVVSVNLSSSSETMAKVATAAKDGIAIVGGDHDGPHADYPLYSFKSRRLLMTLILLVGLYATISMRSHIGVAMVCMVNATAVKQLTLTQDLADPLMLEPASTPTTVEPQCKRPSTNILTLESEGASHGYRGTLVWSTNEQSLAFSAGFYGNCVVMLFSGYIADRYGPRIVSLIAMAGMCVTMALSPFVANLGFWPFFGLRILFGVFENPIIPALSSVVARWFPAMERSSVAALFTSGNQLAASLGAFIATKLCSIHFIGGWPLIFYLAASIGAVWMFVWYLFGTNSPSASRLLSQGEKDYLYDQHERHFVTFAERKKSGHKMPLFRMIFSTATLAVVAGQFSFNFTNTMLVTFLPTYARDVLAMDLRENGLFTALPFFIQLFSKNVLGNIADALKRRKILTPSASCKVCQAFASFGAALVLILMATYIDCTRKLQAFVIMCFYGFCFGGAIPGSFTSSLSIAPIFAGMIMSFTLVAGNVGNILAPAIAGFIVKYGTKEEWSIVFFCMAAVNFFGGLVFVVFGTAKVQPWALPENKQTEQRNKVAA